jgi:hypothetical protein
MTGSTKLAQHHPPATSAGAIADDDNHARFTVALASATNIGLSPRWVQYSGISLAARAAAEVLVDIATMHTHGDQAPQLDRERLAYFVGVGRADKLASVIVELESIGFLTIYSGGLDPITGKRRQRRDKRGRPIPDRFSISLHPPTNYVGPCNLTEADAEFVDDRDAAYTAAETAGKRLRTGNITILRTSTGHLEKPQVTADPGFRGQLDVPDPAIGGRPVFPQVTADPGIGGHLQIDQRSSISEGEIEDRLEPVSGGAAKPPATGRDEAHLAEVRGLVRRLPWTEWAQLRGVDFQLSRKDADQVQAAMAAAITTAGITLDEAIEIGRAALADVAKTSQPVGYVVNAFGPRHLPGRLRALTAEPLAADPVSLPVKASPSGIDGKSSRTRQVAQLDEPKAAAISRPECSTCGSSEGDGRGGRTVTGEDGFERPCPDCNSGWRIGTDSAEKLF